MSTVIKRLNPPMPVNTPKGRAHAHFLIDYGWVFDLVWVCEIDLSGECWCVKNANIRFRPNWTMETGAQAPPSSCPPS